MRATIKRRDIKITTPEKENKRLWKKKKTEKKINRRGVSPEKPEIKSNPPELASFGAVFFTLFQLHFNTARKNLYPISIVLPCSLNGIQSTITDTCYISDTDTVFCLWL